MGQKNMFNALMTAFRMFRLLAFSEIIGLPRPCRRFLNSYLSTDSCSYCSRKQNKQMIFYLILFYFNQFIILAQIWSIDLLILQKNFKLLSKLPLQTCRDIRPIPLKSVLSRILIWKEVYYNFNVFGGVKLWSTEYFMK